MNWKGCKGNSCGLAQEKPRYFPGVSDEIHEESPSG